jgi:hypothetical protein
MKQNRRELVYAKIVLMKQKTTYSIILKDRPTFVPVEGDKIEEDNNNVRVKLGEEIVASFQVTQVQGWKSNPEKK